MKIIVVGSGMEGFFLARSLLEHGHQTRLIEQGCRVCNLAADKLGIPVFHGDGTTVEALQSAGAQGMDALIAATGRDPDNLVACQLAKQVFHIRHTAARVSDPKNAAVMKQLGVDLPLSSTESLARLLESEANDDAIRRLMPFGHGEAVLCELELPREYRMEGARLAELQLPEDAVIVSITRDGHLVIPRGSVQLFGGDKLLAVCGKTASRTLSRRLGLGSGKPPTA